MTKRRKFSAEFRAEAVELVISSGRPVAQVAPEIGVVEGTLGTWVRTWKDAHPEVGAAEPGPVDWAKYQALQAENAELKREVEFLGKVSAFFAAKPDERLLRVHLGGEGPVPDRLDVPEIEGLAGVVLPLAAPSGADSDAGPARRARRARGACVHAGEGHGRS